MQFYKRDGSARHKESNKSTPQWKARQRSAIVFVLLFVFVFSIRLCLCAHGLQAYILLCVFVCASSPQRSGRHHTATIVASLSAFTPSASQCLSVAGEGVGGSALLSWTGKGWEGVRKSKMRGGGDVSLGRLLGAGRGAPIIVAGDRRETSPSNPSSSACKSCHRGSSVAPRASHPVCQLEGWGTETRGPSRPKGRQDQSWG